jgi:putative AdoMet-dependent methyltransferase
VSERQSLFENWASDYDDFVLKNSFPFLGYEQALQAVFTKSRATAHSKILELGTGTGNLSLLFAEIGCELVCTDFSSNMLKLAHEKLPNASFVSLDLIDRNDWPKISGRFDCIVASYILHEFPLEWNLKLLSHLTHHHLNLNGRIVFADIAFPDAATRASAAEFWADSWDETEFYFAGEECVAEFYTLGLQSEFHQISACAGVFTIEQQRLK